MMYRFVLMLFAAAVCVTPASAQPWYASEDARGYRFSSTVQEGSLRGFSDLIRSQGEASRAWSESARNLEEARGKYIENSQKWMEFSMNRKRVITAEREQARVRDRASRERNQEHLRSQPNPELSPQQVDFATGKVRWPRTLDAGVFAENRRKVEELLVLLSHAHAPTLVQEDVQSAARTMQSLLKSRIHDTPPQEYIAARKFLEALATTVQSRDSLEQFTPAGASREWLAVTPADIPELLWTLETGELSEQHEALLAMQRLGPSARHAVPSLLQTLKHPSVVLRHSVLDTLRTIGDSAAPATSEIRPLLASDNPLLSVPAARALSRVAPSEDHLAAAVPVLMSALGNSSDAVRSEAAAGLAEVGPAAVPALLAELQTGDQLTYLNVADALAALGPAAEAAVPELIQQLNNNDDSVCWHSARALGAIHSRPDQVVPALMGLLRRESRVVRTHAAYALGQYGSQAAAAVPALMAVLPDKDLHVRLAAAQALGHMGSKARDAVPALANAMEDTSGAMTLNAADALASIGPSAVPALTARLQDPKLAQVAAHALGQIGPAAHHATPRLAGLLKSNDPDARREAVLALAAIGPQAVAAVPRLEELLEQPGNPDRAGAAFALSNIVPAEQILPRLRQTIATPDDPLLRFASAWGLATLGRNDDELVRIALPELMGALLDDRSLVRLKAAEALAGIGPAAANAVPILIQSLNDPAPMLRSTVLTALAEIGPAARTAVPSVAALLDDDAVEVRYAAAYALGRIGPAASGAVPDLQRTLAGPDAFGRTVAAWALVHIDPRPEFVQAALPLMIDAVRHKRPEVRVEAADVLGRIGRDNASARTALEQARQDDNADVRRAAEQALQPVRR